MRNLEQSENNAHNIAQIFLAKELYAEMDLEDDEIMHRWVNDGYAERFREYMKAHPETEEGMAEKEEETLSEIKKGILFH